MSDKILYKYDVTCKLCGVIQTFTEEVTEKHAKNGGFAINQTYKCCGKKVTIEHGVCEKKYLSQ